MYYAIRDQDNYQNLDLEVMDFMISIPDSVNYDDAVNFSQSNLELSSWWPEIDAEFEGETSKEAIPDLRIWIDASLVLSPKAYRLLGDLLAPHGEFLPVTVGSETFQIFNARTFAQEDQNACDFIDEPEHPELPKQLSTLAFEPDIEAPVFKSKLQSALTLYCGERFKSAVKEFELTGVGFDTELIKKY